MSTSSSISNTDTAYNRLRELIVTGEIEPGEILQERSIAKQLGLGRTPVREAIQRLALERVLTVIPRRGIVVARLGMPEIQEMFEARTAIEGKLAALAAQRRSEADAYEIMTLAKQLEKTSHTRDILQFLADDQELHHTIAAASGNRYLAQYVDHLLMISDWLWHQFFRLHGGSSTPSLSHDLIVEAIVEQDAAAAREAMWDHISQSRDILKESL